MMSRGSPRSYTQLYMAAPPDPRGVRKDVGSRRPRRSSAAIAVATTVTLSLIVLCRLREGQFVSSVAPRSGSAAAAAPRSGSTAAADPWPVREQLSDPLDEMEEDAVTGFRIPRVWPGSALADEALDKFVHTLAGHPSIQLNIASYRDWQCRSTIASALSRATHPGRLTVAVVDQVVPGDTGCDVRCGHDLSAADRSEDVLCAHASRIHVYRMDARNATGPILARHVAGRMYRGEAFVLQMDAHNEFVAGWDESILAQWRATRNEYAVLSTYLTDLQGSISSAGHSQRSTRPIMCNSAFEGQPEASYLRHGSQPEEVPKFSGEPMLQPYWAAGFSFSRGHFVVRVPYDCCLPFVFQGEEISMGVRGWSHGYDFYAPASSVMFHEYASHSKRRGGVKMFWENQRDRTVQAAAMQRLIALAHLRPEQPPSGAYDGRLAERYGIGRKRPISLFYRLFQIDRARRRAQPLCELVRSGQMHRAFVHHLRPDGRGIDYDGLKDFDWSQQPGGTEGRAAGRRPTALPRLHAASALAIRRRYASAAQGLVALNGSACARLRRKRTCRSFAVSDCAPERSGPTADCCTEAELREEARGGPSDDALLLDRIVLQPAPTRRLRLLCVVSTFAERHALARAAASSWLTQCDGALVLSDRDDESVPATGVPHAGPEGAESWQKSRANWRVLHALVVRGNASYDYVAYGGDDYIVLVDNLRSLLDSAPLRSQHERSAPLFLGRRFTSWRHQHASLSHFNAGGPGVVLNSRYATRTRVLPIITREDTASAVFGCVHCTRALGIPRWRHCTRTPTLVF